MRLKSITPRNFGPFGEDGVTIPIEDEVTVLTGANDTGKSQLLRLMALLGSASNGLTLTDLGEIVNLPYSSGASDWQNKDDIGCTAVYAGTAAGQKLYSAFAPGNTVTVRYAIKPGQTVALIEKLEAESRSSNPRQGFGPRQTVIRLPESAPLPDIVKFASQSEGERRLLRLALGAGYSGFRPEQLGKAAFDTQVRKRQEHLNEQLSRILPADSRLRFRLGGGSESIAVSLRDEDGEMTPLSYRGSGIRSFTSHVLCLVEAASHREPCLVLFDEPETGLHSDLQHSLRRLLEGLAKAENIQVVIATHSPCFINTRRASSVRLLKKVVGNDQTRVEVVSQPFKENWLALREGLGLTAADSLLYGDITVVVEGMTEVVAFPLLLRRLSEAKIPGFVEVEELLERIHWLPGDGDSYPYMVKLASQQGNQVLVVLDGDKRKKASSIREENSEVGVVVLPDEQEAEDLVPRESYFAALKQLVNGEASAKVTMEAFAEWEAGQQAGRLQRRFSKRVGDWFLEVAGFDRGKVEAMHIAVRDAPIEDLAKSAAPLLELVDLIRRGPRLPTKELLLPVSPPVISPSAAPERPQVPRTPLGLGVTEARAEGEPTSKGLLMVRGRVLNDSRAAVAAIQVGIDVSDETGNPIGSQDTWTSPPNLGPGEAGSFKTFVQLPPGAKAGHVNAKILHAQNPPSRPSTKVEEFAPVLRFMNDTEAWLEGERSRHVYDAPTTNEKVELFRNLARSVVGPLSTATGVDLERLERLIAEAGFAETPNEAWAEFRGILEHAIEARGA